MPPRSGSSLPTSAMQSTPPRRVHSPTDPAGAWATAHLELGLSADLAGRALAGARIVSDPGNRERGHCSLQSALASVLAHGRAERRGLNPRLKLADPLAHSCRLAVHGILQNPARLARGARSGPRAPAAHPGRGRSWSASCGHPPRRTCDESAGSGRSVPHARACSPPPGALWLRCDRRVAAAFLIGHPADHQRATLDLLADPLELLSPLLLGPLTRGLHTVTSPSGKADPSSCARPLRSDKALSPS